MARILIVEDEKHMLMGLKDNLEFEGYELDVADDGALVRHGNPHDVIELAGFRTAQCALPAGRGQAEVLVAILDPLAVLVMVPGENGIVAAVE